MSWVQIGAIFAAGFAVGQLTLVVVGVTVEYLRERAVVQLAREQARNGNRRRAPAGRRPERMAEAVEGESSQRLGFSGAAARKAGWLQ